MAMKALIVILIIGIFLVSGCSGVGDLIIYHNSSLGEAHEDCANFCGREYEPVLKSCTDYLCECSCKKPSIWEVD